jgi:hypothetical protein
VSEHDPSATPNPAFPNLDPGNHRIIGPATDQFNCIAWACGDTQRWWQPSPHFYWPVPSGHDDPALDNLLAALAAVGYSACRDGTAEPGFEKVAVFADAQGAYTHAARQLPSGAWASKLGAWELIEHDTPEAVAGGIYGQLHLFMRRPLPNTPGA